MGIASALRISEYERNFVIACDIPDIDIGLVRALLRQAGEGDAVVPTVGVGLYEPLFAVYRQSALPAIEETLRSGSNRVFDIFTRCQVKYIDLSGRQLKNVNTMSEYRQHIKRDNRC